MTATSGAESIARAGARKSLLEVLKDLQCLPATDEFPDVDETLLSLDDPLEAGSSTQPRAGEQTRGDS